MPEDQEQNITARGLKTELIAPIATTVGTILAGVLKESLPQQALANLLIVALALLSIFAWTYTAMLRRQRAKISKLETRIRDLESESSSLRNPPAIEDLKALTDIEEKLLAFLTPPKGRTIEQIAAHLGISAVRAEVTLSALAEPLLVYRQGYTEGPSYWCLGSAGKTYLVNHGRE